MVDAAIMKKNNAFSLIELLVSISIIGIIITIGLSSYSTINKKTHDTKRKSDIEQLRSALEMYRTENKFYPTGGCVSQSCQAVDLSALAADLLPYMSALPTDPNSSQTYWYKATDVSNGAYYGYCLSANLEQTAPTDTCTPDASYNWGIKNP